MVYNSKNLWLYNWVYALQCNPTGEFSEAFEQQWVYCPVYDSYDAACVMMMGEPI